MSSPGAWKMSGSGISGASLALSLVLISAAGWSSGALVSSQPLLLFESARSASALDCVGIAEALDEISIVYHFRDLTTQPIDSEELSAYAIVVACHLTPDHQTMPALAAWAEAGGGLLATGSSALGMEATLGLSTAAAVAGDEYTDVRFTGAHAVATGAWWNGPMTTTPPMPASEIPVVVQHYYFNPDWPAYAATAGTGTVVARWRDWLDDWDQPDGEAAVVVHQPGAGRTVYSAPLPGVYVDWDWPHSWRTFIVSAVEWLAADQPLVEIGYWPDAHRAALAWTGDTERPAMVTAVPALLKLFKELGLERFGTFYIVGRAGGDGDTLGAEEHPEIVAAIVEAGAEVGGHGDTHEAFTGQPYATQHARLEAMQEIITPLLTPSGQQMRGFRAPYLSQDQNTWQALSDLGVAYDAGETDVWSATTLPHRVGDLWQLPPTMPMDWHLFEAHGLGTAAAETSFLDKLDYVIHRRGLFSWLHHPWVIEDHLDMVRNVLNTAIDRGDVWMARQDDILDWWIARKQVRIDHIDRQQRRLEIHLHNHGNTAVNGASIWVRAPAGTGDWHARVDHQSTTLLQRRHASALFLVAVIPVLAAEQTTVLTISMEDALFSDRFQR